MRTVSVFCLSLLAASSATALSPVTRVVELMKGLSVQIEKDGKKEEDLFESYVCWGKSVISQKTASNEAAATKIEELETYIADLAAGRIELTGERAELEKEIAELMNDLEEAKELREKEHEDFKDAETEMNQAIDALNQAIEVLGEATKDHKEGVLLAVRARLTHGMESLAQREQKLKHAVALGEKFLAKADATFLKRVLTAEVPKADWKKLNRKATFKMSYKARSFKIQDTLKKMLKTFEANLQEATEAEAAAEETYQKLTQSKGDQLAAAQEALQKSEVEGGARNMNKDEAQDEVNALKQQVADDEKFIQQTAAALEEKKKQWKERSELRTGELAALSKAIEILHNDDSRDLFKKSLASQESFLQVRSTKSNSAASILRTAARKSGDARLLKLAKLASANPAFAKVLTMIDEMISTLQGEEEKDLAIKEECEEGRMHNTREAILTSRHIDEQTDLITKLTEEIEQISKEVEEMKEKIKQTALELKEATELREKEHKEFVQSDSEDKQAAELVESAKGVLEQFYQENDLVFMQAAAHQPAVVEAGKAPPPPPATFEGGYGGKTGEAQGIVAIMDMIHEDILADKAKAETEEHEAQDAYDKMKEDSEELIKTLTQEIEEQEGVRGKKETEKVETKKERGTDKGELNSVLKTINEINPNCEYYTVNYKMRAANRQVEIDGLVKAKAILQGAKFEEAMI